MNNKLKHSTILVLAGLIFLSSCTFNLSNIGATPTATPDIEGSVTAAIETVYAEATEEKHIAMLSSTATSTLTHTPSATMTPSLTPTETFTPSITPTETPTSTNTPVPVSGIPENAIVAYFVIIGSGGPVACGDSLIPVLTGHYKSGDPAADLRVALNYLFSAGQYVLGLYNATYTSSLRATSVDFHRGKGSADAQLTGSYVPPATKCDAHRYRAQVWTTAYQFDEVKDFTPWLGGALLGDRLYASMLNAADE
ncbi:MAG: hypothetical protein H8D34_30525 [Chloroflexi bacterium]|nr:hypothetical protein [Chloroflexota bacterium]